MTYQAVFCPACNNHKALRKKAAILAPFVAERALATRSSLCGLMQCETCGLMFFEDRFTDYELACLYKDYRGADYVRARNKHEPWYTQAVNEALGGEANIRERREVYGRIVKKYGGMTVDSVLDYGGDRGQMMRDGPGQTHYVYDISGVEAEPGVIALDSIAMAGRCFDLVLLCEVLEHVPAPFDTLLTGASLVRPGGLLYVTVPNQEFLFKDIPGGAWYRNYLVGMLKVRWLTLALDFWSTAAKVKFHRIPPFGFVKLHEHINFFDQESLKKMLMRSNLEVLSCEDVGPRQGLAALCRKQ
jgi:SAM-dependent methyltransferase